MTVSISSQKFLRDARGTAVLEFAFLAPLMLGFMLGCIVTFDAVRAARQASTAATTVSDLATRVLVMHDDRRDAIFAAGEALLGKYAASGYNLTMTSVANVFNDNTDDPVIVWAVASESGGELNQGDLAGFELPFIPEGESVVLVTLDVNYEPIFQIDPSSPIGFLGAWQNAFNMNDIAVRRPRFVAEVCYEHDEDSETCGLSNDD